MLNCCFKVNVNVGLVKFLATKQQHSLAPSSIVMSICTQGIDRVSIRLPTVLINDIIYALHTYTHDGTSEENDFIPLTDQRLTIPFGATSGCQNITIIGDRIVEDNEEFSVVVNVQDSIAVLIGPNSTTVTIIDDDGMSHM